MAVNQTWPYRGQEDGWFLAHGGLRLDMAGAHFWGCVWAGQGGALVGSSGQCPDKPNSPHPTAPACRPQRRVEGPGQAEQPPERVAAQDTGRSVGKTPSQQPSCLRVRDLTLALPAFPSRQEVFSTVIHHHHKNEEDIAFPYVATRAELPAKMAADHKALVAALEECAALVGQVVKGSSTPETLAQLIPKFDAFAAETEEHLVEEEEGVLPAMRHFFTPAEWKKNVEEEILKNAKPRDLGWLLRQKPAVADKKAWMRQVAKLPGPVISLVMMPAINGFERDITRPMQQLISGATVPEPAPGCACSIM